MQHGTEMADTRRQLTEVMRGAADAQARLAVLEAAKGARRALQQGGDGADDDECLDPAHVAVAASDMAWAVSRAFDTHLGDEFPQLVASVGALAEQLGAKADISTVDALILILAATPAAEEGRAALHANGCSASSTDSSTVCEPAADGLEGEAQRTAPPRARMPTDVQQQWCFRCARRAHRPASEEIGSERRRSPTGSMRVPGWGGWLTSVSLIPTLRRWQPACTTRAGAQEPLGEPSIAGGRLDELMHFAGEVTRRLVALRLRQHPHCRMSSHHQRHRHHRNREKGRQPGNSFSCVRLCYLNKKHRCRPRRPPRQFL